MRSGRSISGWCFTGTGDAAHEMMEAGGRTGHVQSASANTGLGMSATQIHEMMPNDSVGEHFKENNAETMCSVVTATHYK